MPQIQNPILPGFNPDPSIVRVGEDYYLATSTFEWFPGVQIHHSGDLANWELITRPLNSKRLLDMRGDPDGGGIWAPCLTYSDDLFWLVYTDVRRRGGSFKDAHNFITTSPTIKGPWSNPVHVNSTGFDPSLFHDSDGRKYFMTLVWDHRQRQGSKFAGIQLQEYSPSEKKLVGPRKNIFHGTRLGCTEGAHIYQRNGWYYLLTAEGGTGPLHAATLARSNDIWGPYEVHPKNPILTARERPHLPVQQAGHADIFETSAGKTYLVHLMTRPILCGPKNETKRCVLGRETSLREATWDEDGWLYLDDGTEPAELVEVPAARDEERFWAEKRYSFERDQLHIDFQWLRTPEPDYLFTLRDGKLVLFGRESIGSWYEQSLVARRFQHYAFDAETVVDFQPEDSRQFAGLVAYYSRYSYIYITVTATEEGQRELWIMSSEASYPLGDLQQPFEEPIPLAQEGKVHLKLSYRKTTLQFYYAMEGQDLKPVGREYDATILSDECGYHPRGDGFTGAFVGMAASDLNGSGLSATFDYFVYRPVKI